MAGQYAVDLFIGSTLEIDQYGNSSTLTPERFVGFGGAPNMGSNPRGRRHASPAWLACAQGPWYQQQGLPGAKAVVQIARTVSGSGRQAFVERLSCADMSGAGDARVMVYGDDVTHVVSENGIAHLWRCRDREERRRCICALAGQGSCLRPLVADSAVRQLRAAGLVSTPADIGVDSGRAHAGLLAARTLADIVAWSGGLYSIPASLA
jgi:malonate decarboxylase alpha subunit